VKVEAVEEAHSHPGYTFLTLIVYRSARPRFRHSHGGTGCESAHKPHLTSCTSSGEVLVFFWTSCKFGQKKVALKFRI